MFMRIILGVACGAGKPVILRNWPEIPPGAVAIMKEISGSSSPLALASPMYLSAMGTIASSAAFCASLLAPSQSATTTAASFKAPGPAEMFATGLGYHGNSSPVGSADTDERPSFVMTEPSLSMTTNEGMPETPKRLLSCSFSFRQEYESASTAAP